MATTCERNKYEDDVCTLQPVNDFQLFAGFSCGEPDLDDYIRNDAATHDAEMLAKTYAFQLKKDNAVSFPVAFVCLLNDVIRIPNRCKSRLFPEGMRYRTYPAVKIGRLGVSGDVQGAGIGSYLLWTIKLLFLTDNRTGCRFVTVDAYNNPRTVNFYNKNGFSFLTAEDEKLATRTLYLDLKRVAVHPAV